MNIYYSHLVEGQPVANGLPPHLINMQNNWQDIYAVGLVNHLHLNPDAFLSAVPVNVSAYVQVKQLGLHTPQAGEENWYVIDTSYDINAALSPNGFFVHIPAEVLDMVRQGILKIVIWHAHECPYQHNPYNKSEKPLWYLELLQRRLEEYQLPAQQVCIVTSNLNVNNQQKLFPALADYKVAGYNYFRHNYFKYIDKHYTSANDSDAISEGEAVGAVRTKKFICLNATPVHHRTFLVAEIFRRKLNELGHISFINRRNADRFGWDENFFTDTPWQDAAAKYKGHYSSFFNALPIQLDADAGTISGNDRQLPKKYILDSFFSIITESVMSDGAPDNPLFITEKTYKPLYYMHPFMVAGCKGTLACLKSLGFETFPELFDEGYDDEDDLEKRMMMILTEVERVCNMSNEELNAIYTTMRPKLRHNRHLLMSSAAIEKDFINLLALVQRKNSNG